MSFVLSQKLIGRLCSVSALAAALAQNGCARLPYSGRLRTRPPLKAGLRPASLLC